MAKGKLGKLVALSAVVGAGAWVYKKYDTIKSMYHKVSIFKGDRYEFDEFDGEAIAAMFSGVMIDLSDVTFSEDEVYLDIYALCSGIRVLIPKDVEVVLEGSNNASGVQVDQNEDTPKTRTLYINYNITASGLQITDNVDDCCDDPDCCCEDDDDCCSDDDCCCGSDEEVSEAVEEVVEAVVPSVEEVFEEASEVVTPVVEEVVEEVEAFEEADAFEEVALAEKELDKAVNEAAQDLDEAAQEVEEAIDNFMDQDDVFNSFDTKSDDEDDFFD